MNYLYNAYVIRDNGSDDVCLPFFVQNDTVAMRQFASTLRTLPPSCRSDFQLEMVAQYDHQIQEFKDSGDNILICIGSDDEIKKMIELDTPFYARNYIDKAPVTISSKDGSKHE